MELRHGAPLRPRLGSRRCGDVQSALGHSRPLEAPLPTRWSLDGVREYAARIAGGTIGFRLRPSRIAAKAKLSQDQSPELVARSITMLRSEHDYRQPALADAMQQWPDRR